MKECARDNIGMVKKQAEVITFDFQDMLWHKGILGEESPNQLGARVLFLISINCGLRAGDEHYDLTCEGLDKPSQFSFKRNDSGVRCLVYQEDTITKTNGGGLDSLRKERKV